MIVYLVIFLISIIYGTTKLITNNFEDKLYRNLNWIFWIFYTSSILTLYYREFTASISIFILGVLISLLIIFKLVIFSGDQVLDYSFWVMYVLSVFTLLGLLITVSFLKSAYYKMPPVGNKGLTGPEGPQGQDSKDMVNTDLCFAQIMNYANTTFYDWKLKNGYEYDDLDRKIKNFYFQQRIKSICNSENYKNDINNKGVVKAINDIKSEIRNIIIFILGYKNGVKFLEDPVLNDYSWNDLLDKKRNETKLPFNQLKDNKVWNYHRCLNYKIVRPDGEDPRNKCNSQ